jgi:glycosyltransferase involved in cell wall biosynthesis
VTVIMPVFNRRRLMGRALAGVAAQTRQPESVVVIDDASDDGSDEVAREAGAQVIRLDHNSGPGMARQRGLTWATTPWAAFLDSDDRWAPDHLETLFTAASDDLSLIATTAVATTHRGPRLTGNPFHRPLALRRPADVLRPENAIWTSATMVRVADALAGGGSPRGRLAEDLELWLRVLTRGPGVVLQQITVQQGLSIDQRDEGLYRDRAINASAVFEDMKSATLDLLDRYVAVGVLTERDCAGIRASVTWDRVRAALTVGHNAEALRSTAPFRSPPMLLGLVSVLARRRAVRRRWRRQKERVATLINR